MRKVYDMYIDGSGGNPVHCVKTDNEVCGVIIECDCGCHMLKVQSDVDIYHNSDGSKQVRQDYYLAMFNYGNQKRNFFARLRIAFNYLRTGKMFADQLVLKPDEIQKLVKFIDDSFIETVPDL